MKTKFLKIESTASKARQRVEQLRLYVPNSRIYGAAKAFDLFGTTFAYSSIVRDIEENGYFYQRKKLTMGRKKIGVQSVIEKGALVSDKK